MRSPSNRSGNAGRHAAYISAADGGGETSTTMMMMKDMHASIKSNNGTNACIGMLNADISSSFADRYHRDEVEAFRSSGTLNEENDSNAEAQKAAGEKDADEIRDQADGILSFRGTLSDDNDSKEEIAIEKVEEVSLFRVATTSANKPPTHSSSETLVQHGVMDTLDCAVGGIGGDVGGLFDDDVKNMKAGLAIANNVAEKAAKKAPSSEEVVRNMKAGIAFAEEAAKSARRLISDTKKLAEDMDLEAFHSVGSTSYSYNDISLSGSVSTDNKYRDSDSEETLQSGEDEEEGTTCRQSSSLSDNASDLFELGVITQSIASNEDRASPIKDTEGDSSSIKSAQIAVELASPVQYAESVNTHVGQVREMAPQIEQEDDDFSSSSSYTEETVLDDDEGLGEGEAPHISSDLAHAVEIGQESTEDRTIAPNAGVIGVDAAVPNEERDDSDSFSEYTEVTYLSEHDINVVAEDTALEDVADDDECSEYTEVTVDDDEGKEEQDIGIKQNPHLPVVTTAAAAAAAVAAAVDIDNQQNAATTPSKSKQITLDQFFHSNQSAATKPSNAKQVTLDRFFGIKDGGNKRAKQPPADNKMQVPANDKDEEEEVSEEMKETAVISASNETEEIHKDKGTEENSVCIEKENVGEDNTDDNDTSADAPLLYRPKSPEEILSEHTISYPPVEVNWIAPPIEQRSLIDAVIGTSIGRRSNACGAIKVLAAQKGRTYDLAQTYGLLDALVLAAKDVRQGQEREVSIEARTRAVIAIAHLSEAKENRVILAHHAELVATLVQVIKEDKSEARMAACRSLAMLSKMQQNKALLVKANGFAAILAEVMGGRYDQHANSLEGVATSLSLNSHGSRGNSSRGSIIRASSTGSTHNMTIRQTHSARHQEYLSLARMNCCAAFSHLVKDCFACAVLCKNNAFLDSVLSLCSNVRSPMYMRCLEILCQLTRFPGNCAILTSRASVIKVLITSGNARSIEERLWALRSFQNLAIDSVSRIALATDPVLDLLASSAFRGIKNEQDTALGALLNISLEPGTIISLTNTKNLIAILVHITNNTESSSDSCRVARRTLLSIGTWINTLAGANEQEDNRTRQLPTGWMKWE